MDEPGEHHSQQTDTRTENEIPHVPIYLWNLKIKTIELTKMEIGRVKGE